MDFERVSTFCNDIVTVARQLIEKHREYNLEKNIGFIDYAKAFDRVTKRILWVLWSDEVIRII